MERYPEYNFVGAGINYSVIKGVFNKINLDIKYVIDSDKRKQGELWNGIPIVDYLQIKSEIKNYYYDSTYSI